MRTNLLSTFARSLKALGCCTLLAATAAAVPLSVNAQATKYPSKPITLILPFPAGSTSDTITRILQNMLGTRLGVPVVVENKPGGSGEIAYSSVSNSAPDGHTLLLTPDAIVVNAIVKGQGLEPIYKRLTPVTVVAEAPLAFIIPPSLPVKNLREFMAYVKERPGKLNFGSSGVGSVPYLSVAYLMQRGGLDMVHIPYRGAAQSMNALFSGDIQLFLGDVGRYIAYKDQLKALVVTGPRRDPRLPDVESITETFPGASFGLWLSVWAPAGTPQDLVQRINAEITAVQKSPEFQAQMANLGYEAPARTVAETEKYVRDGYAFWNKVVVDGKIRFEP